MSAIDRLRRGVGAVLLVIALAGVAGWLCAQALSDRWLWSQYLCWVPIEAWAVFVLAALGPALVVMGRPGRGGRQGRRGFRAGRAIAVVGLVAILVHVVVIRWRVPMNLARPAWGGTPGALRVMHWNVNDIWRTEDIASPILRHDPDLVALVNLYGEPDWRSIILRYGGWDEGRGGYDRPISIAWENGFLVMTRLPIVRHGSGWLGIPPAEPELDAQGNPKRRFNDPGRGMYVELRRPGDGGTFVVWVLDLPSDLRLPRALVTREAMEALRAWTGAETRRDGGDQRSMHVGGPGFPEPDLIVGDFNIPRGSASLRTITRGLANAHDQGGLGYAATFPIHRPEWPFGPFGWWARRVGVPLVHIDQTFVGPGFRAARYGVTDPGSGFHAYQRAEIVARDGRMLINTDGGR